MPRIRTIKPEFWRNKQLAMLPEFSRLVAIAILNIADDEGYFEADAMLIRGDVFPYLEDYRSITVALRELSSIDYVCLRTTREKGVIGMIPAFKKHQVINKPAKSKLKEIYDKTLDIPALHEHSRSPTVVLPDDYLLEQGTGNREKEVEKEVEAPPESHKGDRFDASKIELPEKLRTDHHREAWVKFVKHRSAIKKPIKETSINEILAMLERMTPDVAYASLVRTVANQWQGLRECPRDELHLFRQPLKPGEIEF
jgi:hypothetical protein